MFSLLAMGVLMVAPPDLSRPWWVADRVEVAGWSRDGTKVALRLFDGGVPDDGARECPGYVDGAGKPFVTGLALVLLDGGKPVQAFRIQDPSECTPPAEAKKALEAAKAALVAAGIDTAEKTVAMRFTNEKSGWLGVNKAWPVLVQFIEKDTRAEGEASLEGEFQVKVRGKALPAVALPRMTADLAGAGGLTAEPGPAFVSPNGVSALVLVTVKHRDAGSTRMRRAVAGVVARD